MAQRNKALVSERNIKAPQLIEEGWLCLAGPYALPGGGPAYAAVDEEWMLRNVLADLARDALPYRIVDHVADGDGKQVNIWVRDRNGEGGWRDKEKDDVEANSIGWVSQNYKLS